MTWSASRLYFAFLWGEILLGTAILLFFSEEPLVLIRISAAANGAVMFLYSLTLLYMNNKILSRSLSMSPLRFVVATWSCAFFGYFTIQALRLSLIPMIMGMVR
jgi:exosortase/archaeosortase